MKITVHPLFLLAGLLSAVFGGFPTFIICALTALLHECGHIFCAARLGLECDGIKLMPYGASAACDVTDVTVRDEIMLALAGPLVNALICVFVAGLWWFEPVTYGYTDVVFYASAAMLALNLLPAYPLDGGRVARCLLSAFVKPKALNIAVRCVTLLTVAGLTAAYFTLLNNITLLTVAAFLLCSAFEKSPQSRRINFALKNRRRCREIKYMIVGENATYRDALRYLSGGKYLILQIYGEKFIDEITEDELYERMLNHSIYDKLVQ